MRFHSDDNVSDLLRTMERIPASKTRQDIIESFNNNEEDGLVQATIKVSLICPLSKKKIRTPVRSKNCHHFQCFDLDTYCQVNFQSSLKPSKTTWTCPVCSSKTPKSFLVVDEFFVEVLESEGLPDNANIVVLDCDGSWTVETETTANTELTFNVDSPLNGTNFRINKTSGKFLASSPRVSVKSEDEESSYESYESEESNVSVPTTIPYNYIQYARRAEMDDAKINEDNENRMIVGGLPKISSTTMALWQEKAKQQVSELVAALCPELKDSVVYVRDLTSFFRDRTQYSVEMSSKEASLKVRDAFGQFFKRNGRDWKQRPALLQDSKVSISNCTTLSTRIRVKILKMIATRYKKSGSRPYAFVTSYTSKPELCIRVDQTWDYLNYEDGIEYHDYASAVTRIDHGLRDADLEQVYKIARPAFRGQLKKTFLILNDDYEDRNRRAVKREADDGLGGYRSAKRPMSHFEL